MNLGIDCSTERAMRSKIESGASVGMALCAISVHGYLSFRELSLGAAFVCTSMAILAFGLFLFLQACGFMRTHPFLRSAIGASVLAAMVIYIAMEIEAVLINPGALNTNLLITIPTFHLSLALLSAVGLWLCQRWRA
jgi:hypothetical protein